MSKQKRKPLQKRILMLLENLPYPDDYRVRREALALTMAGYKVTVICPSRARQPKRETIKNVNIYRFPPPLESNGMLAYIWEYVYTMTASFFISLYLFFQVGFDVIHIHQPPDTFSLIAGFYKLFGKKYVLDHHDLSPELYDARFRDKGKPYMRKALLLFEKIAFYLSDHVITTNQSYRQIEMERGGIPASHITIVRNGPYLADVAKQEQSPSLVENQKTTIGYMGVMGVQDGVDYLLRSIRHLVFDLGNKEILCLIVGDGSAMPDLQIQVRELGISDYVTFTGWVSGQLNVQRYLDSMDICVAPEPSDPYNKYSTATKVMEYMAAGKPIVAFDIPEHRFSAQGAALYAKPNEEMDFAVKIEYLINNPRKRETLGQIGRKRIESELAWEFQAANLVEAYRNILGYNE